MQILRYIFLFFLLQFTYCINSAYAITPSQRAAINIWLEQQQDINPRPINIISTLKNKAQKYKITISSYSINLNTVKIKAKTKNKSNINQLKRILDTTFMFEKITIKNSSYRNKYYYFELILIKANIEKRGVYKKSKHAIYKSKTQVKYSIVKLIDKTKEIGNLKIFCPGKPLKLRPSHIGSRIKLLIYSYDIDFIGSYNQSIKVLNILSNNKNYISLHNIKLTTNKNKFNLNTNLRFYQQASRHNNLDKPFAYSKVKTVKLCQ